ncbi:hypothetical protein [Candidatus Phyllobacterium onerii]|uniref:hypothetical protein n=1 Tax=Candidatus Phyllobacterium onerii TaxID=3020828 RepID=UPI00232FA4C2|nr:hypothetical protein [Phyllobacterium sp. IY22]
MSDTLGGVHPHEDIEIHMIFADTSAQFIFSEPFLKDRTTPELDQIFDAQLCRRGQPRNDAARSDVATHLIDFPSKCLVLPHLI